MNNVSKSGISWLIQAVSGALLVILLGVHWIAQHYVASGGLRSYAEVVSYLRQPWVFGLETLFLTVVTIHALLGVRAVMLDFAPRPATMRIANVLLIILGIATIAYGFSLTLKIVNIG